MHVVCFPHRIPRIRKLHKNVSKGVMNLAERNVGTKEKNPKQGLTSSKILTIKLIGDVIYIQ